MSIKIVEVYDGRLPEYQVVEEVNNSGKNKVLKTFETLEEAEYYCDNVINETPCGEEAP